MPFILTDRIGARPSRLAAALRGIMPADDREGQGARERALFPFIARADEPIDIFTGTERG